MATATGNTSSETTPADRRQTAHVDAAPALAPRQGMFDRLRGVARRSPTGYALAKRMYGAARYWLRKPHEEDFALFRHFEGVTGLFVDIGANTGQSARSLRIFNRSLEIVSFEPNRLLEPDLRWTRWLLGGSFRYELFGLGQRPGRVTLYVPVAGRTPHTPWASIDPAVLESNRAQIESELGGPFTVAEVQIEVRRLDDFHLNPVAIKMDVEGLEVSVLEGMRNTLELQKPILMVEANASEPDVRQFLTEYGYSFFHYDPIAQTLIETYTNEASRGHGLSPIDATNYFAIHETKLHAMSLLPRLRLKVN